MQSNLILEATLIVLTVAAYGVACSLARRSRHPLLHPVTVGAAIVIVVLAVTGQRYAVYRPAAALLTAPLGPATVALALPIYAQRARLRAAALPFVGGVIVGMLTTTVAAVGLCALFRLNAAVGHAVVFKSVTTAIAVELARLYAGAPALTAVFVVLTGAIGATIGPAVLTRCGVRDAAARGIALGAVAMAMGTAVALKESEESGALSSLALFGSAVVTALVAPVYLPWLFRLFGM